MDANERLEMWLDENPLVKFSVYTDSQVRIIRRLGQDILEVLNGIITGSNTDANGKKVMTVGPGVMQIHGQFWLWTLGAFEIVRTMCQAKNSFADGTEARLNDLKLKLSLLRIPFAKQELPRQKKLPDRPVHAEPSIFKIVESPPDITYMVQGQEIAIRTLIAEFDDSLGSIKLADVLADHRSSYQ